MKKILTLGFVLAAACSTAAFAQVRIAPKVGLNIATVSITGDNAPSPSSRVGFQVGATLDLPAGKLFSVQPSLLYTTKGYIVSQGGSDGTLTSNYVELPVNLVLGIPLSDNFKILGQLGPYVALCTGGKAKVSGSVGGVSLDETRDLKVGTGSDSDIKAVDFGLNGGVGFEVSNIQAMVSYGVGLTNVSPNSTSSGSSDAKVYNRTFQITLGYFFGGKN